MFDLSGSENDTIWDGGNTFEVQTHYTQKKNQITFLIIDETKSNHQVSKVIKYQKPHINNAEAHMIYRCRI
jgi:hypothetical protein